MSGPISQRVASLIDASTLLGGALLVLDHQGRILGVNPVARELFGPALPQQLPQPCAVLRAQFPELVTWVEASLAGRQASPFEWDTPSEGGARWWSSVLTRVPNGDSDADGVPAWLWRAHDITQWRAPQRYVEEQAHIAALRESEFRLRAVLDAGFDAVCVARAVRGPDGRIEDFLVVDVNLRAAARAGMDREQMIGLPLLAVFPNSRAWGLWEECCRVLLTRKPLEAIRPAPMQDQPTRWLERQIVPVDHDSVAISSRDVTDRQIEQMALVASEARHRQLFENNGALQLLADADTSRILDVNAAAEMFYGWPRATMQEMFVTDLDGSTLPQWQARVGALAVGSGTRVTQDHRLATGERRRVENFLGVTQIGERRALHIIVQDITERAKAERRLRDSEAQFRAVINGMREGVLLYDEAGVIRVCNHGAIRILGLDASQLLGTSPERIYRHAQREDGTAWPLDAIPGLVSLRTGESQPPQLISFRRHDGEVIWLSVTADPLIRSGEASPHGAVSVFSDVTEVRTSSERLQQMQKLEAVAQLAGGIAHDFNNLLTVISGATSFLRDSLERHSPLLEDVGAIERAMLRSEAVELNQLLRDLTPRIREQVSEGIDVRYQLSSAPLAMSLDRSRLVDAVTTLVSNAVAAMPTGGQLTLRTDAVTSVHPHEASGDGRPRRFVVLSIQDTGLGMEEATRARLFEPFFSTQPFGNNHGMGLAMVHGMVHQSRGFIECDSQPGVGTTLRLYFPMSGTPPASSMPQVRQESSDAASGVVLVVDDDPMLRELGRRMIEKIGEQALTAASGAEALELLEQRGSEISAVITDLTMPEMGGLELIARMAERYPTLPVVAISGFAVQVGARATLDARQVPFVAKPFAMGQLADALALARARAVR